MKMAGVLVASARPAARPRCALHGRGVDGVSAAADPNDRLKLVTARVVGPQGSQLCVGTSRVRTTGLLPPDHK